MGTCVRLLLDDRVGQEVKTEKDIQSFYHIKTCSWLDDTYWKKKLPTRPSCLEINEKLQLWYFLKYILYFEPLDFCKGTESRNYSKIPSVREKKSQVSYINHGLYISKIFKILSYFRISTRNKDWVIIMSYPQTGLHGSGKQKKWDITLFWLCSRNQEYSNP